MDVLRKYDYTRGQLPELIDVIIEEKTRLFVSAIGVPPREVVDKLHEAGILIMNVSESTPHPWLTNIAGFLFR
jgi:NAD(P)H-dependent flavin oxidoreductase YrpB (nitropropane dioxygenase family)